MVFYCLACTCNAIEMAVITISIFSLVYLNFFGAVDYAVMSMSNSVGSA